LSKTASLLTVFRAVDAVALIGFGTVICEARAGGGARTAKRESHRASVRLAPVDPNCDTGNRSTRRQIGTSAATPRSPPMYALDGISSSPR
jgi:hypothetical protein